MISHVYSILLGKMVCFNRFILKFALLSPDTCCECRSSLKVFFFSFLFHIYWLQDCHEYFLHFLESCGIGVLVRLPFNLLQYLRSYAVIIGLTLTNHSVALIRCCDDRPFSKFSVVFPARCCDNRSFLKVYLVSAVRCCDNRSFLNVCFSFCSQVL